MKTSSLMLLVLALASSKAGAFPPDQPEDPNPRGAFIFVGSPGEDADLQHTTLMDQLKAAGLDTPDLLIHSVSLPPHAIPEAGTPAAQEFKEFFLADRTPDVPPASVVTFRQTMEEVVEPVMEWMRSEHLVLPKVSFGGYQAGGIGALKLAQIFSRANTLYKNYRERAGAAFTVGCPFLWDPIKDSPQTGMVPQVVVSYGDPSDGFYHYFSRREGADDDASLNAFQRNTASTWNSQWLQGSGTFASLGHKPSYKLLEEGESALHVVEVPITFASFTGSGGSPLTLTDEAKNFTVGMLGDQVPGFHQQDPAKTAIGGWKVHNPSIFNDETFYTPVNLTNDQYNTGILRGAEAGFVMRRTPEVLADFVPGKRLKLANGSERLVTKVEGADANPWHTVYVEGESLGPVAYQVGFPLPIKPL